MIDKREANLYSPLALAFMGDAVYEQLVRENILLSGNTSAHNLHEMAVKKVRAAYQAKAMEYISDSLTEDELSIAKRGRNATGNGWHIPKSSDHAEYSKATALETLFGWLYLQGKSERIRELFEMILKGVDT